MDAKVIEGKALHHVLITPDGFAPDGSWPLVVLMHGFGANMYDLAGLASEIDAAGYVYAFPNAPYPLGGGLAGNGYSWMLGRPGVEVPAEPGPSVEQRLEALIAELISLTGANAGNIVLGGFSQGAGMTLTHGLLRPETFRGLAVLSGFFRAAEEVRPSLPAQRTQPIFLAHGRQDPVVALAMGHETKSFLETEGYDVEYHEYDMPHSIIGDEIADLTAWLHRTLPPKA
jgi:phospholipase/carboxylesterase